MFNEFDFIDNLKSEILNHNFNNYEALEEFIFTMLDSEVIYYSDCFDIIKALNFTDFENDIYGTCNNVTQAAYCALHDLVFNQNWDILDLYNLCDETSNVDDEA
jgi:hypothetical protein